MHANPIPVPTETILPRIPTTPTIRFRMLLSTAGLTTPTLSALEAELISQPCVPVVTVLVLALVLVMPVVLAAAVLSVLLAVTEQEVGEDQKHPPKKSP